MTTRSFLTTAVLLGAMPAMLLPASAAQPAPTSPTADPNQPVICLLPGRVRRLGSLMTYQERREPAEMTASECAIRGGEYTFFDRAHYETALAVWMEGAEAGDAQAQVYVGEIHEKGWIGAPDHAEAARWYQLAADQGDATAQRRLAYLHEFGLGVAKDSKLALGLWRDALGIEEDLVLASELEAEREGAALRIAELDAELERQYTRTAQLERQIDQQQQTLLAERRRLDETRDAVASLELQLESARTQTGDPERERELQEALAALEAEREEQSAAVALLTAELEGQRAQIVASNRQAEVRESQLARARTELAAEAARGDELLEQLAAQRESLQRLEAQIAGATDSQQIRALQETLQIERSRFAEELAAADIRQEQLSTALEESRAERAQLAAELDGAQQRLGELDTALGATQAQLADARATVATLRTQVQEGSADTDRQQLLAEIDQQQKKIAALEADQTRLDERWKAEQSQRNQLLTELTSERKTTDWLSSELKEYRGKLHRAQHAQKQTQRALDELKFEKTDLLAQLDRLNADLRTAQGRGREAQDRLNAALDRTRTQLADANSRMAELERSKAQLESEIELNRNRQQTQMLAMRGLMREPPAAMAVPAGMKLGRYKALIIANYDYLHLNDLDTPRNDAAELQSLLGQRYGFDVEVRINLSRSEMYEALNSLRNYSEDDFVVVYYAGHGQMDEFGEGYWLPTDYRQDQPLRDAISTSDITRQLKQSPARHVMLVADSCYAGALLRNAGPVVKSNIPGMMKFWVANRSRTVMTSGGLSPVLDQGLESPHSVFAAALLETLRRNDGAINGERLHAMVHNRVLEDAAKLEYFDQQPQFAAIEDAGHENGQFVFVRTGV
jgi:TPR repeat protein/predicted  nucleic acid-binding Zn-ribbon protein